MNANLQTAVERVLGRQLSQSQMATLAQIFADHMARRLFTHAVPEPTLIQNAYVHAVQEPGDAWFIQVDGGQAVATITVDVVEDAQAWALRIEAALNEQSLIDPVRQAAAQHNAVHFEMR